MCVMGKHKVVTPLEDWLCIQILIWSLSHKKKKKVICTT